MEVTIRRRCVGALLVFGALNAACSSASPETTAGPALARQVPGIEFPEIDDAIGVAVFMDQTGAHAGIDAPMLAAIETEAGSVNAAGGVDGVPLSLATFDSRGDVVATLRAYRRVRDLGVNIVIAGCDVEVANALAERSVDDDVVFLDACSVSPGVAVGALGHDDSTVGAWMGEVAVASGWQTALVVAVADDTQSAQRCGAFVEHFVGAGGSVEARYDIDVSTGVDGIAADVTNQGLGASAAASGSVGIVACVGDAIGVDEFGVLVDTGVPVLTGPLAAAHVLGPDAPLGLAMVAGRDVDPSEQLAAPGSEAMVLISDALQSAVTDASPRQIRSEIVVPTHQPSLIQTTGFGPLLVGTWTDPAAAAALAAPVASSEASATAVDGGS